jgi:hypothetical protein
MLNPLGKMLWDRVEKFNASSPDSHYARIKASEFSSLTESAQRSRSIRAFLLVVGFPPFLVIPRSALFPDPMTASEDLDRIDE